MSSKRAAKKRTSFLLRLALVAFSVFMIVAIVKVLVQTDELQERLDKLDEQTAAQQEINAALENRLENTDDYLESEARKNGMAKPGESVWIEIPNND